MSPLVRFRVDRVVNERVEKPLGETLTKLAALRSPGPRVISERSLGQSKERYLMIPGFEGLRADPSVLQKQWRPILVECSHSDRKSISPHGLARIMPSPPIEPSPGLALQVSCYGGCTEMKTAVRILGPFPSMLVE